MKDKIICVVGSGQMGQQIALNAAIHGFKVKVTDSFKPALEKTEKWKEAYLDERVAKGKMSEETAKGARANFDIIEDIDKALAAADIVIEAVKEELQIKRELFAHMDKVCKPHTILASNSSSFEPSKLASATNRPDRVVNMHFFNPVLVMELVEVIKGPETSDETAEFAMQMCREFGKLPILLKKEINGFVVNRILGRMFEEACRLVQDGISTPHEIDLAVEKALRHPMGPFKIMDMSGMDTVYLLRVQRYADSKNEIDKPQPLMKEMYEKGWLGKKTGKGFYDYK